MTHTARIEAARKALGWSKRRLAREANVDASNLCRFLRGDGDLNVRTLERLDAAIKGARHVKP